MTEILGVWHDEWQRFEATGRLDEGPCWCPDCLAADGYPKPVIGSPT